MSLRRNTIYEGLRINGSSVLVFSTEVTSTIIKRKCLCPSGGSDCTWWVHVGDVFNLSGFIQSDLCPYLCLTSTPSGGPGRDTLPTRRCNEPVVPCRLFDTSIVDPLYVGHETRNWPRPYRSFGEREGTPEIPEFTKLRTNRSEVRVMSG